MPKVAIQKLKQIAREVPSASVFILGYGLRVMLRRVENLLVPIPPSENQDSNKLRALWRPRQASWRTKTSDKLLAELRPGKQGLRSVPCGCDFVQKRLHVVGTGCGLGCRDCGLAPPLNDIQAYRRMWRLSINAKRWLSEAKSDYKVADHLNLQVSMFLQSLPRCAHTTREAFQALTLLTDLKTLDPRDRNTQSSRSYYKHGCSIRI
jgi:hypothetical protein